MPNLSPEQVRQQVHSVLDFVSDTYHHLHSIPELSHQEHLTADFIASCLDDMGIPYRRHIGGEGILATLVCANPNTRHIALRAEFDALPITEQTNLPFASTHPGIMHACGHDAHTASLLGVIKVLLALKPLLHGTFLFIFQPGEEKDPGGARLMLNDGVFSDREPDIILAQHSSADHNVGDIAISAGQVMASADEIHFTVHGHGGHGALPHLVNDTVLCAAQMLVSLQQVVSRLRYPFTPSVLTFGNFIAKGATNVIPSSVQLDGSFRAMDEQWRQEGIRHILRVIHATAQAYGCTASIDAPIDGYPSVFNDPSVTTQASTLATSFLGSSHVLPMPPKMTAEDFGFFSSRYPSCFFRFGVRGSDNPDCGDQHTATFRISEQCFPTSVGALAFIAANFIPNKSHS